MSPATAGTTIRPEDKSAIKAALGPQVEVLGMASGTSPILSSCSR